MVIAGFNCGLLLYITCNEDMKPCHRVLHSCITMRCMLHVILKALFWFEKVHVIPPLNPGKLWMCWCPGVVAMSGMRRASSRESTPWIALETWFAMSLLTPACGILSSPCCAFRWCKSHTLRALCDV